MKIIIIVLVVFYTISGQDVIKTPEEVTLITHKMVKENNWKGLGKYFDIFTLREFRKGFHFLSIIPNKELQGKIINNFFTTAKSIDDVKKLNNEAFFEDIYEGLMRSASVFGNIKFDSLKILGAVDEEDSLTHVLTRNWTSIGSVNIEKMEIVTFVKRGIFWKRVLNEDFLDISNKIKASLGI